VWMRSRFQRYSNCVTVWICSC
ncbi:chromosome partition protein MukB, partial [Vibrio parahaemolyticus V-223/04]